MGSKVHFQVHYQKILFKSVDHLVKLLIFDGNHFQFISFNNDKEPDVLHFYYHSIQTKSLEALSNDCNVKHCTLYTDFTEHAATAQQLTKLIPLQDPIGVWMNNKPSVW